MTCRSAKRNCSNSLPSPRSPTWCCRISRWQRHRNDEVHMAASVTPLETLSFEQVRGMLAHRFPFLMIDRVMEIERGKRLRAVKHVTGNELCFLGHFPDHAIFPGVLILEAM